MKKRILSIHLFQSPAPDALPDLAKTLLAFSPRIGIRPPETLYIDITATERLFGSESIILKRLESFFSDKDIPVGIAIADDVATAGVLARQRAGQSTIVTAGENEKALAPLSVQHLLFLTNPLSPPTTEEEKAGRHAIHVLSLLGIHTLKGFARLPASTLGSRFGALGVSLHRRARGVDALPLRPFEPVATHREQRHFEHPLAQLEPLLFAVKGLLEKLETTLRKEFQAAKTLTVYLEGEMGEEIEVEIPLFRPLRHSKALLHVVKTKLQNVKAPGPILSIAIEISLPVRAQLGQFHLFDAHVEQEGALDELLGRLVAGLGPTMISAAALRARHRPEATWKPVPFEPFAKTAAAPKSNDLPERPTLLLPDPESLHLEKRGEDLVFRTPNKRFPVKAMEGPERLVGEWWDEQPHARDYFKIETQNGQHLWVFKTPDRRFYLHGYFD